MFKFISLATLALSAVASVSGAAIPRDEASYDQPVLEPYTQYNTRYNTLGCAEQHGTQFFDDCCHPMKIGETLANNRKAYCNPANASSTAAAAVPTDDSEDDCDDEDESTTAPAPTTVAATTAAASTAPVNVAPAPSSSDEPKTTAAPTTEAKPSTTATPTTTKTTKAASASPSATKAASSGSGQTFTGTATYFLQHNTAGACGKVHPDSDYIVAMDYRMYGDLGKQSQYCGKNVILTNESNGKSITALVADACPTCESSGSLDLSEGAFGALTDNNFDLGVFKVSWQFA